MARLWSRIWGFLKKYVIETPRKSWRKNWNENRGFLILYFCSCVLLVAIVASVTIFPTTTDGISQGLSALITLNAVVFSLVYATMKRAAVLSLRSGVITSFFDWTFVMMASSMLGVFLGVIHLVWQPDRWILAFAVALLVLAPALVPVVAVQELMAQRAKFARAVDKLLGERPESHSEKLRISDDARFLTVRAAEFEADSQNPFAGDVLGRRRFVETACKVVSDISPPAVLLVEGEWGSGKTAFARMCAAVLRSESFERWDGAVVEFNAWTQSHTSVPPQDLVLALTSEIHGDDELREMQLNRVLEAQALKVAGSEIDTVQLVKYEAKTETERFKSLLAEFVASNGGRVAIFIDELDRCRPDHALQMLETVRNLFDVAGVVVVVIVNLDALEHTVKSLLGSDCDVDTYLRRFIDLRMALPRPQSSDLHRFYEHLLIRTGLAERFKGRDDYSRNILWTLAAVHQNSLRDLEQAVHRAVVLLASNEPVNGDSPETTASVLEQIALALLIVREADREAYKEFIIRGGSACRTIDALEQALPLGGQESDPMNSESASRYPIVPLPVLRWIQALLLTVSEDGRNGNLHICAYHNDKKEGWRYVEEHFNTIQQAIDGQQVDLQELADLIG